MTEWWVTRKGCEPVGPSCGDAVIRGIRALKVPKDSFVCEVGGTRWRPIADVPAFAAAFNFSTAIDIIDDDPEGRTIVDPIGLLDEEDERPTEKPPG